MKSARLYRCFLVLLLPLGAAWSVHAATQADPPWRVARLNVSEGAVAFAPAGDTEWTDVPRNRPLVQGDRLWTDKGSRAEIQAGSTAVRMDGSTQLEIIALDDQSAQLSVTKGTVYVRVRSLPELENFEIDTPNLAYRAAYPGDYRIDVDAAQGTTRVTIHSGTGAAYGEGGQVVALGGGQQVTFRTKALVQLASQESPPQDNFDRWAEERNRREDQSISARYVPREVVGYQQLDAHGQWSQDATLGAVWTPNSPPANWAPYRNGHWEWIAPWGWTWIDDAVWGFAPFHYGRWTQINSHWAWVPGRIGLKPVYAPALVAFVGGSNVTWFPLAPGEAWQPAYPASPVYMSNVNRNLTVQPNATYAFQRSAEALTSISSEDFQRGKPAKAGWLQLAANVLTNAQVVPPPAVPLRKMAAAPRAVAAANPPPAPTVTPVVVAAAAAPAPVQQRVQPAVQSPPPVQRVVQPPVQVQARAQVQAQEEQARREQLAKQEQALKREQLIQREQAAKRDEMVKRTERAHREQLAQREQDKRRAEAARRSELAKREELARRDELAKAQSARKEQLARRAEKQKLEQQARRAERARREALAQRDEAQRREAHAQHVEQARKAADQEAQVLRDARAKREREEAAAKERVQRELAQREAQEREVARRDAELRQQQALAEQWRRERAAWEQQQRDRRNNGRPDLRDVDRRSRSPESRGIPIISQPMS